MALGATQPAHSDPRLPLRPNPAPFSRDKCKRRLLPRSATGGRAPSHRLHGAEDLDPRAARAVRSSGGKAWALVILDSGAESRQVPAGPARPGPTAQLRSRSASHLSEPRPPLPSPLLAGVRTLGPGGAPCCARVEKRGAAASRDSVEGLGLRKPGARGLGRADRVGGPDLSENSPKE